MCENLDEFKIIFDQLNKLLQQDSNSVELDWKYFKEVFNQAKNIKHVVIGESPYPKDASGIPLVKDKWSDSSKTVNGEKKYSLSTGRTGTKILERILSKEYIPRSYREEYKTPIILAKELLTKNGIIFLNTSYFFKKNSKIEKKHIDCSSVLNSFVLNLVTKNSDLEINILGRTAETYILREIAKQAGLKISFEAHPTARKK